MNSLGPCAATKDCLCPPEIHLAYKWGAGAGGVVGCFGGMVCAAREPLGTFILGAFGGTAAGVVSGFSSVATCVACCHLGIVLK